MGRLSFNLVNANSIEFTGAVYQNIWDFGGRVFATYAILAVLGKHDITRFPLAPAPKS